jgi:hypothetical protein
MSAKRSAECTETKRTAQRVAQRPAKSDTNRDQRADNCAKVAHLMHIDSLLNNLAVLNKIVMRKNRVNHSKIAFEKSTYKYLAAYDAYLFADAKRILLHAAYEEWAPNRDDALKTYELAYKNKFKRYAAFNRASKSRLLACNVSTRDSDAWDRAIEKFTLANSTYIKALAKRPPRPSRPSRRITQSHQ